MLLQVPARPEGKEQASGNAGGQSHDEAHGHNQSTRRIAVADAIRALDRLIAGLHKVVGNGGGCPVPKPTCNVAQNSSAEVTEAESAEHQRQGRREHPRVKKKATQTTLLCLSRPDAD